MKAVLDVLRLWDPLSSGWPAGQTHGVAQEDSGLQDC